MGEYCRELVNTLKHRFESCFLDFLANLLNHLKKMCGYIGVLMLKMHFMSIVKDGECHGHMTQMYVLKINFNYSNPYSTVMDSMLFVVL